MLKRVGVTGAMAAIAVLAVSSAVPATGHGDGNGRESFRVLSTNTEEEFVDVGKADLSLGDAFVFTSNLTKHGRQVGHTGVVCTVTSTAPALCERSHNMSAPWSCARSVMARRSCMAADL